MWVVGFFTDTEPKQLSFAGFFRQPAKYKAGLKNGQEVCSWCVVILGKKKAPRIAPKCLYSLAFLAPRPGLEPGTYGLTESQAPQKPL